MLILEFISNIDRITEGGSEQSQSPMTWAFC